ncbi:MAG: toprim domain-containing protein [Holosporales bacterium]|nr:toprim domain-containing protein [Holosporales bacterium]
MINNLDLSSFKSGIRLSSLFSSVTKVERQGSRLFASCPFHQEKTPSCKIDDEKGFFYCFGCREHGDVFAFLQKTGNLSFPEAVERLASMAGVGVDCRRRGSFSYEPSKAELAECRRQQEAVRQERQVEQKRSWEEAASIAERVWAESISIEGTAHPYLEGKGVDAFVLRRTVEDYEFTSASGGGLDVFAGSLVVPLCDENSKLWSLQFYPPRKKADESKWPRFFMPGGRIKGCFYLLGGESERLLLAEGYATAASVHMATGEQTVVCFSSGNMAAVASALRRKYPACDVFTSATAGAEAAREIIICADADEAGLKAAKATGVKYVYPKFDDGGIERFRSLAGSTTSVQPDARPSDFNDYANVYGFEDLKKCLMKI